MSKQWRRSIHKRWLAGAALVLALALSACGRADVLVAPTAAPLALQPTARLATRHTETIASSEPALVSTESPSSSAVTSQSPAAATAAPSATLLQSTPTQAPGISATQTHPKPGFADIAPQATRTPAPRPAGACPGGCESPPAGCLIKGTIPRDGYKLYLLAGQPGYASAQIDPQKGERWFCTIDEARSAGWMPSKVPLPAQQP
jgi:hypothetical protein